MNQDRWQKVKGLFEAAVQLPPPDRQRFLDKSCGTDENLRQAVEDLLASDQESTSFLEYPAAQEVASLILQAETKNFATGKSFGHYEIIRQIGAGGMGEVYLAKDTRLDRLVAVKILNQEFSRHEQNLQRFIQEAKAASALNHPNILVIHEIGEAEDSNYIVSEFIEGKTLRELFREASLKLSEILDISIQIANALSAAHAARIVHRDIKPENIILRPDGYVKILDFGLAKLVEPKVIGFEDVTARQNQTAKGVILGTVNYMSPEQAKGEKLDVRTDIFSFGILIYEMIAGKTPFAGASMSETFANLFNADPQPLSRFSSNVPEELQRIVAKTLRKNKDERYQTIKDLLIDLKDLRNQLQVNVKLARSPLDDDPMLQTTIAAHAQTTQDALDNNSNAFVAQTTAQTDSIAPQNKNRSRIVVAAFVLSLIGMLAAGIWFIRFGQNSSTAISIQKVAQITSYPGLDAFSDLSPDGNTVAYCSDHNGSFEIYVKQLTSGAKEIQLTNDGEQNFQPSWSPNGQRIAYYSKRRGGIWSIPASGGEAHQLTDFGSHPAWSPDGKQIVFQSNALVEFGAYARNALPPSTLWIISANSGEPKQLTQTGNPVGGHGSPSFSPDGRRIAFEVDDYNSASIWTISISGTDSKEITTMRAHGCYEPVYAPDGKSIFYASGGGVFQVHVDAETNQPIGEPTQITGIGGMPSAVQRVSFSADGRRIAYSALMRRENLVSVHLQTSSSQSDGGAPASLVQNTNERSNFPVFSPDGKRIAYVTCRNVSGNACNVWLMNADGSNQTQLTTTDGDDLMPSWFPDGEHIAFISKRGDHFTLWAIDLNTKRERMLLDLTDGLDYARLSPDGKQIVFNFKRNGGVFNVWKVSLADDAPEQLTFDKELMGFPAWSPDGKLIAFQMKRGDYTHIMIMPSEGGIPEQLTFDKGQSWVYGWSPDGDKILFAGQRDSLWNIRWISRSTKKQQQLTDYKKLYSFVRYPSWSPDGKQVVYEYSETTGNIWVADLK